MQPFPAVLLDIPDFVLAGAVIGTLLLFVAIVALLTKIAQHLGAFASALTTHMELNKQLGLELQQANQQRRELQEKYDSLERNYKQIKGDNSRLTNRVSQLELDKKSSAEVVQALTAQLSLVKADLENEREKRQALESLLADERQERERIVGEMRSKMEQLSEANAKLVAENQALQKQVDELCDRAKQQNGATAQSENSTEPATTEAPAEKKEN